MRLPPLVRLLSKPIFSSLPPRGARTVGATCRPITTGSDQIKFGNIQGRQPVDETRELDVFLGKWVTHPERWKRYEKYMSDEDKQWHMSDPPQFCRFERNNGEFRMTTGVVGGEEHQIDFKLGVKFFTVFPDYSFIQMLVVQHLGELISTHRNRDNFDGNYVNHMKVKFDRLFMSKTYPDGNVALRVYFKESRLMTMSCRLLREATALHSLVVMQRVTPKSFNTSQYPAL
ncbi:hypothetical protein BsWGS_08598 [Bradybaena similaris]